MANLNPRRVPIAQRMLFFQQILLLSSFVKRHGEKICTGQTYKYFCLKNC